MSSPERLIKMLLPKKLDWVIEVVDVVHEGTVKRYIGSGLLTSPDDEWEEYIIGILINPEIAKTKTKFDGFDAITVSNMAYLEDYLHRTRIAELTNILHHINQLMNIRAKYAIGIFESRDELSV